MSRGALYQWETNSWIQAVNAYIGCYNEKRIQIPLGFLGPVEDQESLGLTA
ncbi:MAG: hypothetical protein JWR68_1270 [Polaromonas sp.]|nr:hypothetical protein [Polaromonas sp.]